MPEIVRTDVQESMRDKERIREIHEQKEREREGGNRSCASDSNITR